MNLPEAMYLAGLVVMVPLSLLSPKFGTNKKMRHIYHLIVGLCIAAAVSGWDITHSIMTTVIVYGFILYLPRRHVGTASFVFAFAYQFYMRTMPSIFTGHATVSGPCNAIQLVLTLKLASAGLDWTASADDYGSETPGNPVKSAGNPRQSDPMKRKEIGGDSAHYRPPHRLNVKPTALEFFAYAYFFPGFLTGPFCSLRAYLDTVDLENYRRAAIKVGRGLAPKHLYEKMTKKFLIVECESRGIRCSDELSHERIVDLLRDSDAEESAVAAGVVRGPPLVVPALVRLTQAIPFALLYLAHQNFFPFKRVLEEGFASEPLWYRIAYSWVSVRTFGFRFPFAWLLAEAACIGSGVAFSGYDDKAKTDKRVLLVARFNAARNLVVREVEFGTDLPSVLRNWNISVHQWVKDYVFRKVVKATGMKILAQFATFLTLAYWHGVRPGYYVFFLSVPLLVACAERLGVVTRHFSREESFFLRSGFGSVLHAAGGWFLTQTAIAYLSSAFIALDWNDTIRSWQVVGWYGHIGAVVLIAVSYIIVPPKSKKRNVDKAKNADNLVEKKNQ